uniref:protein FAM246C-like n=1 Tax=Jaculus jaculus TaxID=51337 RepID=UPI001E1B5B77|nr:protein FAM246C-like [Jaculus jaculus]
MKAQGPERKTSHSRWAAKCGLCEMAAILCTQADLDGKGSCMQPLSRAAPGSAEGYTWSELWTARRQTRGGADWPARTRPGHVRPASGRAGSWGSGTPFSRRPPPPRPARATHPRRRASGDPGGEDEEEGGGGEDPRHLQQLHQHTGCTGHLRRAGFVLTRHFRAERARSPAPRPLAAPPPGRSQPRPLAARSPAPRRTPRLSARPAAPSPPTSAPTRGTMASGTGTRRSSPPPGSRT